MLRFENGFHVHCWCFKLMKAERTSKGPGQLLQHATAVEVRALGMARCCGDMLY